MDPSAEQNRIIIEMTALADRATNIADRATVARAQYVPLRDTYVANGTGGVALARATTDLQNIIGEFNTLPVPANIGYGVYLEAKKGVVRNRFDPGRRAVYANFIAQYDAQSTRFQQIYDRLLADLTADTATIDSEFIDILTHPAGSYNLTNIRHQKEYMRQISLYNDTQCRMPGNDLLPDQIIAQLGTITYADMTADSNVYKKIACAVKTMLKNNRDAVLQILNTPDIPVEDPIIQNFFQPHQVVSDTSVEGVVWRIGYNGSAGYFATMKTSKRDPANHRQSYNMLHELLVGLVLNFLRPYTPNFMYVWGGFSCSSPTQGAPRPGARPGSSVRYAHNFDTLCVNNTPDNMDVLMLNENVANASSFFDTFQGAAGAAAARVAGAAVADLVRWVDILAILFQIIISLAIAQNFCKFVHGDLHARNVLVKRLPAEVVLQYTLNGNNYQLTTRYIAVIIDYGFSRVTSVYRQPNANGDPLQAEPNNIDMPPLKYAWDGAGNIHEPNRPENVHYRRFMPLYDIARLTATFDDPAYNLAFNRLNNVLNRGLVLPVNVNVSGLFNWYLGRLPDPRNSAVFDAPAGVASPMADMARNLWAELANLAANVPAGFI
jgi:hypothetical protein